MPVSTPNRVADPVQLEQYVDPGHIKQVAGLAIPFYNELSSSILPGEPFQFANRICVSPRVILPGEYGTAYTDWIVDFLLDTSLAANIIQGQIVYWDFDIDVVTPYGGGDVVDGIGAATDTLPTNGMILGRAVGEPMMLKDLSSNNLICATTSSLRVRVASLPGAATVYGTGAGSVE